MLRPYGCQQIFVHSGPFTGDAEVGVVRTNDRLGGGDAVRGTHCVQPDGRHSRKELAAEEFRGKNKPVDDHSGQRRALAL